MSSIRRFLICLLPAAAILALGACDADEPTVEVSRTMKEQALERIAQDEMPDYRNWEMNQTGDGVRYVVLRPGSGEKAWYDDEVRVHYKLWLTDGTFVDSTFPDGVSSPFEFTVGDTRRVIAGWHEIIQEMSAGTEVLAVIPWELGYGRAGRRNIPRRADLVFYIDLLRIR